MAAHTQFPPPGAEPLVRGDPATMVVRFRINGVDQDISTWTFRSYVRDHIDGTVISQCEDFEVGTADDMAELFPGMPGVTPACLLLHWPIDQTASCRPPTCATSNSSRPRSARGSSSTRSASIRTSATRRGRRELHRRPRRHPALDLATSQSAIVVSLDPVAAAGSSIILDAQGTGPPGPRGPQGIQGVPGTPGTAALHAATHADGGTDPLRGPLVLTNRLTVDGAQGIELGVGSRLGVAAAADVTALARLGDLAATTRQF